MQYTNKLNSEKNQLFEQPDLFARVLAKASPKVRAANDKAVARISDIERMQQLADEFKERRKLNEREDDEANEIWYELMDNEVMADELAVIAEPWFLEWALAVYKDKIQSDAIREAYTEYQMICEWETEVELQE